VVVEECELFAHLDYDNLQWALIGLLFSHGDFVIVHRPAANCLKLIWDMKTLLETSSCLLHQSFDACSERLIERPVCRNRKKCND
jgi:hypothetical protein